ncbi:MAG: penicillin acylase family protein [Acidobacteriota bacterium]
MRRLTTRVFLLILLLVLIAAGAGAWRIWRALPERDGVLRVSGLHQPVVILRDPEGVPHIRAATEADAQFALGYVHAQDRLWQMEFQRRIASGRLSEILGPQAIETDRLMRTIGFARAAVTAAKSLTSETRGLIDAYVAGVNAFIGSHRGTRLPVEFTLMGFEPKDFSAEDVLAWHKVMGWSMSTNWREELLRIRLVARVGLDGAAQLLPAYTDGGPVVLPDLLPPPVAVQPPVQISGALDRLRRISVAPLADPFVTGGSNNWVVSGARTATGKPLLANDPHLGTQTPGVWYVAHLTGGSLDVIGATLPGTPGVVIGHNRRIAWGVTNMMSDVQDFFAERINERDEAETDGRWEPMEVLHERIMVRGAPDVGLRVRITRHGPLLSDLFDERTPLALRWTGHDAVDRTAEAFLRLNRAGSWTEFVAAFGEYHLPMLNFVYADVEGNIGYLGPGALPIRLGDGRLPLDGSLTANDWRGYVPAEALPRSLNPAQGFIASANNKVVPDSYPYHVSSSWEVPYRAIRITSVLETLTRATLDDMKRLQTDQHSAQVGRVLPFLLSARPASDRSRSALSQLKAWNGSIAGDDPVAAIFKTYYARATWRIFSDDLGLGIWNEYRGYSGDVAKGFDAVARASASPWCDDVTTAEKEDCPTVLGQALELALQDLELTQGPNQARWRWDRQNDVWFPHLPLQASRLLRPFFSRHVRRGGDAFTVNPSMPVRDQMLVASYRQVIDLSNLDASAFILPLGQSGELLSGHYADLLEDWNEGRYRPLRFSRAVVDAAAEHHLALQPQ